MIKGTLFIDGAIDMERMITLLADNGYTVRVKQEEGFDAFTRQYRIDYKCKNDEFDEDYES